MALGARGTIHANAAQWSQSALEPRTTAYAVAEMLAHAEPILVLSKFGVSKTIPRNVGGGTTSSSQSVIMKYRRAVPFGTSGSWSTSASAAIGPDAVNGATTALTEGVTPDPQAMRYEDVTVYLKQYGAVVQISDVIADTHEDPVLKDAAALCGEQAAETLEALTWDELCSGTNVINSDEGSASGSTSGNAGIWAKAQQRRVTQLLKKFRAKPITSMIGASPNVSTEPVAPAYVCFMHTDAESVVRDATGFTPVEQYGSASKSLPYEVGRIEDVRYIASPLLTTNLTGAATTGASGSTNYEFVYVAKDSYGTIALKGSESIKPIVLNPGTPSAADPLGQQGFVGWKTYFAAKVLNDTWAVKLVGTLA